MSWLISLYKTLMPCTLLVLSLFIQFLGDTVKKVVGDKFWNPTASNHKWFLNSWNHQVPLLPYPLSSFRVVKITWFHTVRHCHIMYFPALYGSYITFPLTEIFNSKTPGFNGHTGWNGNIPDVLYITGDTVPQNLAWRIGHLWKLWTSGRSGRSCLGLRVYEPTE